MYQYLYSKVRNKLSNDSDSRELFSGSAISMIGKLAGMVANFAMFWLIAFFYGASTVGVFTLVYVVVNFFSLIGKIGLDISSVKLIAEYKFKGYYSSVNEYYNKVQVIAVISSVILTFLLFFSAEVIADEIFSKANLGIYLKWFSPAIIPLTLLLITSESLRGLKKIKEYSFFNRGAHYLGASIFISLFYFTIDLDKNLVVILSFTLALLVSYILAHKLFRKHSTFNTPDLGQEMVTTSSILLFSYPLLLSSAFSFLQGWSDTLILGIYASEAQIGIYNVALKITTLTQLSLNAVNSISGPKFSEFHSNNDMDGLRKTAQRATKLIFLTSLPVLLVLIIFPEFILGLYGDEFVAGKSSLIYITIGRFYSAISGSVGLILMMTGYQKLFQKVVIITTLSSIGLNFLLIPILGIEGAAISNMVAQILANTICMVLIFKKFNIFIAYIPFLKNAKNKQ